MSDYGFATKDLNGNNAINAKNPIFGFDMGHRPMAFKTFHITDAKEPDIHTGNVTTPNPSGTGWSYGTNMDCGVIKELVKKTEHGYNFRPVGYATVTGTLKRTSRVQLTQTQRAGTWGGNYNRTFVIDEDRVNDLIPTQNNQAYWTTTSVFDSFPGSVASLKQTDFAGTIWSYEYPKGYFVGEWGQESFWTYHLSDSPISVEFDEKYIYIYQLRTWSDTIRRCKLYSSYYGRVTDDIQERVKISARFAGSTYDVTIYLCPYPLKELL